MSIQQKVHIPADGIDGLKQYYKEDGLSGFLVFLLALPLSLGIAGASDFPPIMGLITAMIGGVFVSVIAGSPLTIKGPAAGLIVIVAAAVADFGGNNPELGWKLTLGAILVAGILQIFFGFLRIGTIADLFPLSTIQGMLTAIGIIIFSKQIHILFGVNPLMPDGRPMINPPDLIMAFPETLRKMDGNAAIVGFISLLVVFIWPRIKHDRLSKVPAPIMVLAVAIPVAKFIDLDSNRFIHFEHNLTEILAINVDFGGMQKPLLFAKYVLMFALVGSLESLLTVKATDMMDPLRRKSNANKDLMAVGVGNTISAVLGGLPMISEVARSSANVNNGAKTRWANGFHGLFMLVFLMLDDWFSNLIPVPALAAMLIGVGYRLASPRSFGEMAKVGVEQIVVVVVTILVTLFTDLLLGIGAGVITKLITQLVLGAPKGAVFKAHIIIEGCEVRVAGAAVFSNWLGLKRVLNEMSPSKQVIVNLENCNLVDYTVIDNLHRMKQDFQQAGGDLKVIGLEELNYTGNHQHKQATRNKPKLLRQSLAESKDAIMK
ncbi:MAG: SulP family inorganic anion transporter [Sphingomonadales bacterium]|jgi:MFS superfamily sulfate permease-like transporter